MYTVLRCVRRLYVGSQMITAWRGRAISSIDYKTAQLHAGRPKWFKGDLKVSMCNLDSRHQTRLEWKKVTLSLAHRILLALASALPQPGLLMILLTTIGGEGAHS